MKLDSKTIFLDCKIAWGISLIFFGFLFMIFKLEYFNDTMIGDVVFNPKNYPIYAGVIFFLCHNYKMAAVWLVFAAFLRFGLILSAAKNYSDLVLPVILIIAGIVIVLVAKNGKH